MARLITIVVVAAFVGGLVFMLFPDLPGAAAGALIGAGVGWLITREGSGAEARWQGGAGDGAGAGDGCGDGGGGGGEGG